MKKILAITLLFFCHHAIADRWIDSKNKDEMSGAIQVKKYKRSIDGKTTIHLQISGYGEGYDNVAWISDSELIYTFKDISAFRINLDKNKFWVIGEVDRKSSKNFIFVYICQASEEINFECLENSYENQIRDKELIDKLLAAKEMKIELPSYPDGRRIRIFK